MNARPLVLCLVAALATLAATSLAPAQDVAPGPLVDATLDSMQGGTRTFSAERGHRAIVLFYEDRPHVEVNDALKGELIRFIHDNHLDDRIVAYGVANLGDVGMVPEALVRQMISPLVERWGSDILLDWRGELREAPFSLSTFAANVAVIDRTGRIVYRHNGVVDGAERRTFYGVIRRVVAP